MWMGQFPALLLAVFASAALAQTRVELKAVCSDSEIAEFALECTEDEPCPVSLELVMAEAVGNRIIVSGDFHTREATLWSLLLSSEDDGKSWIEPYPRQRSLTLDQIQFLDFQNGWVAGHTVTSLPRDPFLLRSTDGGKTWTAHLIFDEPRVGFVESFWFDSSTQGSVIVNRRSDDQGGRYLRLESPDGGVTWALRETSAKPIANRHPHAGSSADLRIHADAASKSFRLERKDGPKWLPLSSFPFAAGVCKPAPPQPPQ